MVWCSILGNHLRFFSLTQIATPTKCFVNIGSSHDHLLVLGPTTTVGKETWCPIGTVSTKGCDAFHSVGQRNTLQQLSKRTTVGVTIQTYQEQTASILIHYSFRKVHQPREEVGFVHNDDPIVIQPHLIQTLDTNTGYSSLVVRNHIVFVSVSDVTRMFYNQHAHSQTSISRNNTQNAGGFSRKHRA